MQTCSRWAPGSVLPQVCRLPDLPIWLRDSSLHSIDGQIPLCLGCAFVICKPTITAVSAPRCWWLWDRFLTLGTQEGRYTCGVSKGGCGDVRMATVGGESQEHRSTLPPAGSLCTLSGALCSLRYTHRPSRCGPLSALEGRIYLLKE